jgi:hypothetical protein
VKGSHRGDHATMNFTTMDKATVPLKPGQIMIHTGGLAFGNVKRIGEICAMFIYRQPMKKIADS